MERDSKSERLVAAYLGEWGSWFDRISDTLDEGGMAGDALRKAFQETWPVTWDLYYNGTHDRYAPAALTRLRDPEDATPKWVVATVAGNLPPFAPELPLDMNLTLLFNTDTFVRATAHVAAVTIGMSNEQTLPKANILKYKFKQNVKKAASEQATAEVIEMFAPSVVKLIGGFAGISGF
jgi:hypothetical protein